MFEKTCDYYREHYKMPKREDCEEFAEQIYQRIRGIAEKASFDEIYSLYLYRLGKLNNVHSVMAVIDRKQRFVAALFVFVELLDKKSRSGKESL